MSITVYVLIDAHARRQKARVRVYLVIFSRQKTIFFTVRVYWDIYGSPAHASLSSGHFREAGNVGGNKMQNE